MLSTITKAVEESLVKEATALAAKRFHVQCLHFHLSKLKGDNKHNDVLSLLSIINNGMEDTEGSVYLCNDYDLFIIARTQNPSIIKKLISNLTFFYADDPIAHSTTSGEQGFYTLYNAVSDYEAFFLACNKKLIALQQAEEERKLKHTAESSQKNPLQEEFTANQASAWKNALHSRAKRMRPAMLIIEDQIFSRQLLKESLAKDYITFDAKNAMEGINLYFTNAPDIVFLDIELPDYDGYAVLQKIIANDPEAFVIMTTANNNAADVKKAVAAGARGYIVKPFTKQKVQQYIQLHRTNFKPKTE